MCIRDRIDVNGDAVDDLVVVGDWMNIEIFINENNTFKNVTASYLQGDFHGMWNTVESVDLDGDGDLDLVIGNHGLNSFMKEGARMYINDFDKNGSAEHIICHKIDNNYYPIADKDELVGRIPGLRKKIFYYKDYAEASITDLFDQDIIESSEVFDAETMKTTLLINTGNGFEEGSLPSEVQYTQIYAIAASDINEDGFIDLIFGGNQFLVKPQFGRYDGLSGLIVYGDKNGFRSGQISFCKVEGKTRNIEIIEKDKRKQIIFARNGESTEIYE